MTIISAIISAYYADKYIDLRLKNLEKQDPQPEVIVVALKGSKEAEIAHRYNVMVLTTDNIPTIYAAWNKAIMASHCDYITNANCDDQTAMGAYAEMSTILDNHPEYALVYGNENIIEPDCYGMAMEHRRQEGGFDLLKRACFVGPFPVWRKSLHAKHGYFDENYKVCGDYEFWLRIASHGEKFYHLDKTVGNYLRRDDSAEHRNPIIATTERMIIQNIYKNK